jgi:FtsZ-binding cell division protein ZapB
MKPKDKALREQKLKALNVLNEHFRGVSKIVCLEDEQVRRVLNAMIEFLESYHSPKTEERSAEETRKLIKDILGSLSDLEMASVKYFHETRTVNGTFLLAIEKVTDKVTLPFQQQIEELKTHNSSLNEVIRSQIYKLEELKREISQLKEVNKNWQKVFDGLKYMKGKIINICGFAQSNRNHLTIEICGEENYIGNFIKTGMEIEINKPK